jgi:predicted transcriptional regulator
MHIIKAIRLDSDLATRVNDLSKLSLLSESDIIRLAIKAGLPKLETGEENPFSPKARMNEDPRGYKEEK